jgi:hypothetical protein
MGQDPIEYFSDTWHTNLDTYERIIPEDAQKAAMVAAATIYQLAMRDEMLPRFTKADMPPMPEPETPGATPATPVRTAGAPAQSGTPAQTGSPSTTPGKPNAEPAKPGTAPAQPGTTGPAPRK